jgi:hypothetical protein
MTVLARQKNGRSEKHALAQSLLSFHLTAPAQSHISRLIFLPARISPSALSRLELCG